MKYSASYGKENTRPILLQEDDRRYGSKLSMVWRENAMNKFVGEAMLCDNVLIGDYYQP